MILDLEFFYIHNMESEVASNNSDTGMDVMKYLMKLFLDKG